VSAADGTEPGSIASIDEQGLAIALEGGVLRCRRVRADAGKEAAAEWASRAGVAAGEPVSDG
jgi:methionyl-tRNA formyltransferase